MPAAVLRLLLSTTSVIWNDGSTNRAVGVVLTSVSRAADGIRVSWESDRDPPYLAGVYALDDYCHLAPLAEVETSNSAAFISGDWMDTPVAVCVLVKSDWPAQRHIQAGTNQLTIARRPMDAAHMNRYKAARAAWKSRGDAPIFAEARWRRWPGYYYARADGRFERPDGAGGSVPCDYALESVASRSADVIVEAPFSSLSSWGGLRYVQTTDGFVGFGSDTNTPAGAISWEGAK